MTDRKEPSEALIASHEYLSWLGVTVEGAKEGYGRIAVPYDEKLANPSGSLHGGVVATVVDNAAGTAIRATLDDPAGTDYVTTDLDLSYVRPAADRVIAEGTVKHIGRSTAVVAVDVFTDADGERKLAATGKVSLRIFREE